MANKRGQRYTLHQTDACRAKIKTTQLVNRLTAHAMGELELTNTQVRSIEILLNKTLANLTAAEITADVQSYVARLPQPAATADEWRNRIAIEKATEGQGQAIASIPVVDGTKH